MGNPYKDYYTNGGNGLIFKTYDHATKLYINDKLARAPKVGFLYYVSFKVNQNVNSITEVGLLVKKIDLPKFKIATETINQYNRKTNIQTKITYEPISIEFHDDNSDITNGLWKAYYQYYYADTGADFSDNKFGEGYVQYGLANGQTTPLFDSVDIYSLHQGNFTKFTLINPLVTQWDHDSLDQSDGFKTLKSKMVLNYENVVYNSGVIANDDQAGAFEQTYYDNQPGSVGMYDPSAIGAAPGAGSLSTKAGNMNQFTGPSQSQINKVAALQQGIYNGPNIGYPIPPMPSSPVAVNIPTMPTIPAIPALPIQLN